MIKLDHLTLVSPEPFYMKGVGRIRSPKVIEICHPTATGQMTEDIYDGYLSAIMLTKKVIVETLESFGADITDEITEDIRRCDIFEVIVSIKFFRELLEQALSFFLCEGVQFSEREGVYITFVQHGEGEEATYEPVGCVSKDNFKDVKEVILQKNYIDAPEEDPGEIKSKAARRILQKIEEGRKKSSKRKAANEAMKIGNLVSKISVNSKSLNILNIFDLTMYQLYDQFFELNTSIQLSAATRRWCTWGKDKFDFTAWYA